MVVTTKIIRPKGNLESAIRSILDYYFDYLSSSLGFRADAPTPRWRGRGAIALNLDADTPVTREIVANLLWAKSPDGTKQLIEIDTNHDAKGAELKGSRTHIVSSHSESETFRSEIDIPQADEYHVDATTTQIAIEAAPTNIGTGPEVGIATRQSEVKVPERCKHVPAVDICLSPPKSVSIFWQQCSDVDRVRLVKCFERAVDKFIAILETEVDLARRGKGGCIKEQARLVVASFLHAVSRDMEPQLHYHLLIASMVQRLDGSWGKLDTKRLLEVMRDLSPLFSSDLYAEMYQEFGVLAHRPKTKKFERHEELLANRPRDESRERFDDHKHFSGEKYENWFELDGIAKSLCDALSSRRKSIVDAVSVGGVNSSSNAARQLANLKTRQPKDTSVTTAELEENWNRIAADHGVTPEVIESLMGQSIQFDVIESLNNAVKVALDKITSSDSTFDRLLLIRHTSEALQALPIGSDLIREHISEVLRHSPQIVQLSDGQTPIYTTKEMWDIEQKFVENCKTLDARSGPVVSDVTIGRVIQSRPDLLEEQKAAVTNILQNESSIGLLTGVAGAGKSYAMNAVREGFQLAGYNVAVAAVNGRVAKDLGDELGVPAFTIAQLEYHFSKSDSEKLGDFFAHEVKRAGQSLRGFTPDERKQGLGFNTKTVVFIDESSMLGTRMLQIITEAAVKLGFTLCFLGDTEQLPAIEAGSPFEYLVDSLGSTHLAHSFRQRHAEDREAATLVRNGDAEAAINKFVERGLLHTFDDRAQAVYGLVDVWVKDGTAHHPERAAILTYTREEARLINSMCQARRLEEGAIKAKNYKIDDQKFHVGDRVMFDESLKRHGVLNGTLAKIDSISFVRGTMTFELEREKQKQYLLDSTKQFVTIPLRDLFGGRLVLGYAATNHKIQGATCEHTYALLGSRMASRESAYVQFTRARETTKLFIDSCHAGEELKLITKAIERSEKKHLALDVAQHHELKIRLEKN